MEQIIDLGKIGLTNEGLWKPDKAYERLSFVTFNGEGYISFKDNINVQPDSDSFTWQLTAERGESLYQMMVREGKFSGTEEDFLNEYQNLINELRKEIENSKVQTDSVASALASISDKENEYKVAEDNRISNENVRTNSEEERVTNERNRINQENIRVTEFNDIKSQFTASNKIITTNISKANTSIANADKATAKANTAATSANEAASKANTAATTIDDKISPVVESDKGQNERLDWLDFGIGYIPNWFKKSLVCYYNPSKQGLQNVTDIKNGETFLLKDFSPNHLDMSMYNFQGGGMSGMDGYSLDFNKFWVGGGGNDKAPWYHDFYSITFGRDENGNESRAFGSVQTNGIFNSKLKLKFSGLKEGEKCEIHYRTDNGELSPTWITENKIYDVTIPKEATKGIYFLFNSSNAGSVTIEQIPFYKGALCFDGVDDFGKVQNQLLTLSDYTVFAKRKYENTNRPYCLASKSNATLSGAFILETKYNTGAANTTFSFGKENILECEAKDITYQTQNHYNRYQITKGESLDTDELLIGMIRSSGNVNDRRFEGALYSFLLFNRTLTIDEIEWVFNNIMGEPKK